MKKKKLPSVKTARNKADSYLTPIIRNMFPKCLLCGADTQVAHHHFKKSYSTRLRYELENLIPLCNPCHLRLHCNEIYWTSKVISIKGIEWFKGLDRMKNEYCKADVHWFIENGMRLREMLDSLGE